MRYAIVSDLHANLTAWKTVLVDIADQKADTIICLGDVVGYGPNPVEVLESVYRHVRVTVMGNHDAAVCCRCDPEYFSDRAKAAVRRHQKQLSSHALIWLKHLPYMHQEPDFCCVHGDFSQPEVFNYIIEPESAIPSWQSRGEQLLFVGHSHLPGIYVLGESGKPHFVQPCDFVLEEGKRYIVNPGSVGYPRAGDCRSTYCIYDSETKTILFREIPFDFTGYRESMRSLGYTEDKWLLEQEVEHRIEEVRAQPDFSRKTKSPADGRGKDQAVTAIPTHLFSSKRARMLASLAGILIGVSFLASFLFLTRSLEEKSRKVPAREIPSFELTPLQAYPLIPPDKNLLPPWPQKLPKIGDRIPNWRYRIEEPTDQRFISPPRSNALTILHTSPQKIHLESPWIDLSATGIDTFRLKVSAYPHQAFSGTLLGGILCSMRNAKGEFAPIKNEPFELRRKRKNESKIEFNRKIEIPKRTTHIQFFIDGEFTGTIDLLPPYLGREPDREKNTMENKK